MWLIHVVLGFCSLNPYKSCSEKQMWKEHAHLAECAGLELLALKSLSLPCGETYIHKEASNYKCWTRNLFPYTSYGLLSGAFRLSAAECHSVCGIASGNQQDVWEFRFASQ